VYRLTLPDGRAFTVHQETGLQSIRDLNGNELTVTPTGISHSSGKAVTFQRDSQSRIQSIVDPNGNAMFYGYDGSGDLISHRDRENHETSFTYLSEVPHHLKDIEDPRGITPIRNDYDPVTGRLLSHTDAFGNTIAYDHQLGARQEVLTDRELNVRVLAYDSRGNVIHETDPKGKVVLRSFDGNNNRTCETEPHDPLQSGPDCQSSPNPTLFLYDARDNLLSQTDSLGNTTSFTYNSRNQVLKTKDALHNETENVYDAKGNLTKTIDALGNETLFEYDPSGNVTKQTVTVGGVPQVTEFQYDASGNLKKEIDPLGTETSFTYDGNGNCLTETRTRTLPDSSTQTMTTTFVYDKLGRLVKTTDPDGTFTRTVYDSLGKQKESYDKLGRKTEFLYDAMGQLSKITYPDLTFEEFTYDKEGRRLTSKDRQGRTTTFEYDGLGRLTKTTFPDAAFTENVYDDAGRLTQTIDARGKITRFEYDNAGRRKKVIDPLLNETEFFYDGNGNQTGINDPKGKITSFEYDALNRRTKTIFPDLTFTGTGYDELGRRTSETDQAGIVTGFEYDKLGRLVKVIQDVNGLALETTYGYDEVGNRISQTDANLHTTAFAYDPLGRETKRTLPDGTFETKAYDAAGNLSTWTKFDGSVIQYVYDLNNRLVTKDFPAGTDVTFTYTPTGTRDTVTDARGVTSYAYDLRDRLQTLTYPDGRKLDYGYDENGNRTSLTATLGATVLTTTYAYDDASRLDVVTDPNGLTYDHGYDSNGNRASLAYPNGTSKSYVYDDLNRLTDLTTTGPSGVIQSYQFTLGPAGNRTQIDEADGTTRAYGYDDLYRLTLETVTDTLGLVYQKSFLYDDVGNRLNQTTAGQGAAVIGYTYDTRDRLLTENGTTYGYDANGNLTSKSGEATYTWDFEDRLIRVDKNDGTVVEQVYDTDGVRVRTTTTPAVGSPSVTDFLVDTSGSLSHVVAESDASGAFVAYYVRGDDSLSVIRPIEQRFYHADGVGSIRFLTDEAGVVTDAYVYAAFGEQLSHTGGDNQPYAFTGEPLDLNSNFQYHRARWLHVGAGRFVGMDRFGGLRSQPKSLHKYLYVEGDPVGRVDPSGEFSVAISSLALGIIVSVVALTTTASRVSTGTGASFLRIPTELQPPGTGVGPIVFRLFTTGPMRGARPAAEVMQAIKSDVNKFSTVPGLLGSLDPADTPFKFASGPNPNEIAEGNIYRIDGPFVINPYVKTIESTETSFEFMTMKGHPEAGRVRFSTADLPAGTIFSIRVWAHPSTWANRIAYSVGYHVQTEIWTHFTEQVRIFATTKEE
jgi:RHS repeat-associated protein